MLELAPDKRNDTRSGVAGHLGRDPTLSSVDQTGENGQYSRAVGSVEQGIGSGDGLKPARAFCPFQARAREIIEHILLEVDW